MNISAVEKVFGRAMRDTLGACNTTIQSKSVG